MQRSVAKQVKRTRAAALSAAVVMLLSACASTPVDDVRISVRRIALSLAFENEELAEPAAAEQIIRVVPAPPELLTSGDLAPYRTPDPSLPDLEPEPPLCAAAPEGTALTEAVAVTIDEPPREGWYRRHNKGRISVAGGAIPITLPFPPITLMEIRDVKAIERADFPDRRAGDVANDEAPAAAEGFGAARGTTAATRFTVAHEIATITVTDVYEYDDESLRLVQRTTTTRDGESVFRPTPQIVMAELGDFGNDWSEAGTDRDTNTSMIVQGAITAQEPVDVCGQLVDSLRFENDEQMVNLDTQEISGNSETPNTYNISPQRNGLIVREEKHFTQVVTVDDAKLVLDWDYVSSLGHFEPYPTREDALADVF